MGSRLVPAVGDVALGGHVPDAALPTAPWRSDDRSQDGVDGGALGGRRERCHHVEVHPGQCSHGRLHRAMERRFRPLGECIPRRGVRKPRSGRNRGRELLDPDRGRLELGRAGLRVGRVDRQQVDRDVVLEVEGHEREAGPE